MIYISLCKSRIKDFWIKLLKLIEYPTRGGHRVVWQRWKHHFFKKKKSRRKRRGGARTRTDGGNTVDSARELVQISGRGVCVCVCEPPQCTPKTAWPSFWRWLKKEATVRKLVCITHWWIWAVTSALALRWRADLPGLTWALFLDRFISPDNLSHLSLSHLCFVFSLFLIRLLRRQTRFWTECWTETPSQE